MNEEERLQLEAERLQRVSDLKLQASLDYSWGIFKYQIDEIDKAAPNHVIKEANLRVLQYKQQFSVFSLEYLVNQALQDFRGHWFVMQIKHSNTKFNLALPVAMLKDQTLIYLDDLMLFTVTKPKAG